MSGTTVTVGSVSRRAHSRPSGRSLGPELRCLRTLSMRCSGHGRAQPGLNDAPKAVKESPGVDSGVSILTGSGTTPRRWRDRAGVFIPNQAPFRNRGFHESEPPRTEKSWQLFQITIFRLADFSLERHFARLAAADHRGRSFWQNAANHFASALEGMDRRARVTMTQRRAFSQRVWRSVKNQSCARQKPEGPRRVFPAKGDEILVAAKVDVVGPGRLWRELPGRFW